MKKINFLLYSVLIVISINLVSASLIDDKDIEKVQENCEKSIYYGECLAMDIQINSSYDFNQNRLKLGDLIYPIYVVQNVGTKTINTTLISTLILNGKNSSSEDFPISIKPHEKKIITSKIHNIYPLSETGSYIFFVRTTTPDLRFIYDSTMRNSDIWRYYFQVYSPMEINIENLTILVGVFTLINLIIYVCRGDESALLNKVHSSLKKIEKNLVKKKKK